MVEFKVCESAFRAVGVSLTKRYGCNFFVQEFNLGRHRLFYNLHRTLCFYVVFQREFIGTFDFMCPNLVSSKPYLAGLGESINFKFLQKAFDFNATLLFVYPNGDIYSVYAESLINFYSGLSKVCKSEVLRFQTVENSVNKRDGSGASMPIHEETLVFPIKLLERFGYL